MEKTHDELLDELPSLGDGKKPDLDILIKNLNVLQVLFMSKNMKKSMLTVWWAEQLIKSFCKM